MKGASYIMEFCPKCGSRLKLEKAQVGGDFEVMLVCSKCEYKKQGPGKVRPKVNEVIRNTKKSVTVISKEDSGLVSGFITMRLDFIPYYAGSE